MNSTRIDHIARPIGRHSILGRAARLAPLALLSLAAVGPVVHADSGDNARPVASFTFSPSPAVTGEWVTFTSTSSDRDGRVVSQAWDLDDDGSFDDGTADTATRAFASAGSHTVRLRVRDDDGDSRTTSQTVTVRANAAPDAVVSSSPADPHTDQTVTLTSGSTDPDGRPLLEEWDLDEDGAFDDGSGRELTTSFAGDGVHRVSLRVTDSGGAVRTTVREIAVRNRPPLAAFGVSATQLDTGDAIDFASTSTDPDGEVYSHRWDFDGDGTTDATGPTARHSFADGGEHTVTLTVTDDDGASGSASRRVTIRNRAPSASFRTAPAEPVAGEELVLTSTSTDPDGTVGEHYWDLDGDGAFDDATGAELRTTFAEPGAHMVALQVVDDDGARSAPAFAGIDVTVPSGPSGTGAAGDGPSGSGPSGTGLIRSRLLDPFPRVRIRGVTTARGVRIDLLSVRTIGGTSVLVRCRGRGCPWARNVQRTRFGAGLVRVVRIPGFSGRRLRAGAEIEVFVTRDAVIGKYARLRIRGGLKPPTRVDRCTAPGVPRARRCPAG